MSIPTHEQYVVRRAKARVRLILGYLENQNWRLTTPFCILLSHCPSIFASAKCALRKCAIKLKRVIDRT
jgi:hypothetical protein